MLIGETITVALGALRANKLRSVLTMLGIVIGVGAVIAMMALGTGAQRAVRDRIESLGTTLLTINPHLYTKMGFKPMEDFVPVTQLAGFSQELVCHPSVGVKTLPELLAAAKKAPMSYASGGPGVPGHMAMEMLLATTGATMQHVAYRGPSPAMQDVLGGAVPCGFLASPVVGPLIKDGKLVPIVVSGSHRLASQPSVPTAAEAGAKGYEAAFAEMMAMPRSTPPAVIDRLQSEVAKAMAAPEVRERLATLDLEPLANTPQEAAQRLRTENQRWAKVAERINLQLD